METQSRTINVAVFSVEHTIPVEYFREAVGVVWAMANLSELPQSYQRGMIDAMTNTALMLGVDPAQLDLPPGSITLREPPLRPQRDRFITQRQFESAVVTSFYLATIGDVEKPVLVGMVDALIYLAELLGVDPDRLELPSRTDPALGAQPRNWGEDLPASVRLGSRAEDIETTGEAG